MSDRFGKNITWKLEGDRLILSGTGRIMEYGPHLSFHVLEIQEGITAIEKNAFRDHYEIREVILPRSLKYIEDYAFFDCHYLKAIGPLPPLERISKCAFLHASVPDIHEAAEHAGPKIVDFEDFMETEDFPICRGTGMHPDFASYDVPDEIRQILQGLPYEEQLHRYVFEGTLLKGEKKEDGFIDPPWDLITKILVKDGVLIGFKMRSEWREPWIYVMKNHWYECDWELRESENYPYYSDLHPTMWIRPAGELWLEDADTDDEE